MSEIKHRALAASLLPAQGEQVACAGGDVGEEGGALEVSTAVVYVIRSDDPRMVKIGTTYDVAARVKSLSTGNPSPFTILRMIPGGRSVERWMHLRFSALRVRNEWFLFDPEMLTIMPPAVPDSAGGWDDADDLSIAERLARALRRSTAGQTHVTRRIAKASGATERSVENWLSGKNAMQAEQLMALCSEYDEVWQVFCKIANREGEQARAERALFEIEDRLETWRSGVRRSPQHGDDQKKPTPAQGGLEFAETPEDRARRMGE